MCQAAPRVGLPSWELRWLTERPARHPIAHVDSARTQEAEELFGDFARRATGLELDLSEPVFETDDPIQGQVGISQANGHVDAIRDVEPTDFLAFALRYALDAQCFLVENDLEATLRLNPSGEEGDCNGDERKRRQKEPQRADVIYDQDGEQ